MNKYLVLYKSDGPMNGMSVSEMFANTPPEQMAKGMAAWQAWYGKCGAAILDVGAPLDNATAVTATSAQPEKAPLTGYTILQAASMEEASDMLKDHPHLRIPGSSVQILECVKMPGM